MENPIWAQESNKNLIQALFLLDTGDIISISDQFKNKKQSNEYNASLTLEAFKTVLLNSSSEINCKKILELLNKRTNALINLKVDLDESKGEISLQEHELLRIVGVCTMLNISCDLFKIPYEEIKKKYAIREDTHNTMFLYTENIRMTEICNALSSKVVLHFFQNVGKNEDLNLKFLKDLKFTENDLETKNGLKDLLFLYTIRYLELQGRFNKLYCRHLESILNPLLSDVAFEKSEKMSIEYSLNLLSNYGTNRLVPGHCTIMCNLSDRNGAINEAENVMETFLRLGFHVQSVYNATQNKIQKHLQEMQNFKYSLYDSSVLWVMAHGDKDDIFLSDGTQYSRKKLIDQFCRLEAFKRKPKIIFMTTCQGEKYIPLQNKKGLLVTTDAVPIELPFERENLTAVHYEMDRLIAYSTLPEQYSYRNNAQGSYYVDIVCRLLRESRDRTITTILEKVTQEMHTIIFQTNLFKGKAKQASYYESTLQKTYCMPQYEDI